MKLDKTLLTSFLVSHRLYNLLGWNFLMDKSEGVG